MQTGIVNVPLHGGLCPPWLFEKMKRLGSAIVEVIVLEYGPAEVYSKWHMYHDNHNCPHRPY